MIPEDSQINEISVTDRYISDSPYISQKKRFFFAKLLVKSLANSWKKIIIKKVHSRAIGDIKTKDIFITDPLII